MDPPLRVREDWWVFEKTLKVQGRTGGFSKDPTAFIFSKFKKVLVDFLKK